MQLPTTTRPFYFAVLGCYFALLGLLVARYLWLAPSVHLPTSVIFVVIVLPLLLPLRGLLHGRPRTNIWVALLALLYFFLGVDHIVARTHAEWLGYLQVVLSALLFINSILLCRIENMKCRISPPP